MIPKVKLLIMRAYRNKMCYTDLKYVDSQVISTYKLIVSEVNMCISVDAGNGSPFSKRDIIASLTASRAIS